MDLTDAAAAWRREGFVVLPGYLDGPELKAAQRDLPTVYPTADEYHAAPGEGRNRTYTGDEFGGIIAFPFPTVALCALVVHDKLLDLAEAVFETTDIRIYASELWAKYSGAASYEQEHHRDYLNHTPLVPAADDLRWLGLEIFIWLSDVPEDHGPTHVVPLGDTAGVPPLPHGYLRSERPDFYGERVVWSWPSGDGPGLQHGHIPPWHRDHGTPRGPIHRPRQLQERRQPVDRPSRLG
jgi:phytanoyl-CoA dioxygenase PhyH